MPEVWFIRVTLLSGMEEACPRICELYCFNVFMVTWFWEFSFATLLIRRLRGTIIGCMT